MDSPKVVYELESGGKTWRATVRDARMFRRFDRLGKRKETSTTGKNIEDLLGVRVYILEHDQIFLRKGKRRLSPEALAKHTANITRVNPKKT